LYDDEEGFDHPDVDEEDAADEDVGAAFFDDVEVGNSSLEAAG